MEPSLCALPISHVSTTWATDGSTHASSYAFLHVDYVAYGTFLLVPLRYPRSYNVVPPVTPTRDVTSGNLRFLFELPDTHRPHLRHSHDLSRAYSYYSLRSYSYSPYDIRAYSTTTILQPPYDILQTAQRTYDLRPTSLPMTHNLRPTI